MGAMAELRGLIIVVTFLATCFILIAIIPPQFFASQGASFPTTPKNQVFSDILATNETILFNLTGSPPHDAGNKDFGGYHFDIAEKRLSPPYSGHDDCLWITIQDAWYFLFFNKRDFTYKTENGNTDITTRQAIYSDPNIPSETEEHNVITIGTLDSLTTNNKTTIIYAVVSPKPTIKLFFLYNYTAYGNLTSAYLAGNLQMIIGIDFSERNTQFDAWTLIGCFLTFQLLPFIDPTLALLIEFPMWIAEIYIAFILVLRVIGAVFGGGGA